MHDRRALDTSIVTLYHRAPPFPPGGAATVGTNALTATLLAEISPRSGDAWYVR
jgi:hypothetical protein